MAGKGKVAVTAFKLGVKYGPQIWVATQALREPAKEAVSKAMSSEKARRAAMAHAKSLADGSILKVYKGDASHWVVFSADEPVTVYPADRHAARHAARRADLTKRIRPDDRVGPDRPRQGRRHRGAAPRQARHHQLTAVEWPLDGTCCTTPRPLDAPTLPQSATRMPSSVARARRGR